MTTELIARVDTWLAAHNHKFTSLAHEWRRQAVVWRNGPCRGSEAAMTGILLALVREALGEPELQARTTTEQMSAASRWVLWTRAGLVRLCGGARPSSEIEALVFGLEASL